MSCKYTLLFLFLCGFAALSVSEECNLQILEGTSCTIKLTENFDISKEIKWTHLPSGKIIHRKNEKIRKISNALVGNIDTDGSLTFESVYVNNTGKYKYSFYSKDGTEISKEKEIKVYAKAPKPTVKINCKDGNAVLSCDIGDRTDLTVSWYKDNNNIQNEKSPKLLLSSAQLQENKRYSCSVNNPVSGEKSDSFLASCSSDGGESLVPSKLFGFDFWIMVSILAGGGALLLLLICVLIICACRSCKQKKQLELDEDELRLRVLQDENGTARSKHTARGQPAPPTPQEDLSPPTPTQTQAQPKAQVRGRPPPPPEDDDEDPPPLPRPRNKQHRKRHEEPYRPME